MVSDNILESAIIVDDVLVNHYFQGRKTIAVQEGRIYTTDPGDPFIAKIRSHLIEKSKTNRVLVGMVWGVKKIEPEAMAKLLESLEKRVKQSGVGATEIDQKESSELIVEFNSYLERAANDGCSDVHILLLPQSTIIRVRVDGATHDIASFPTNKGRKLSAVLFNSLAKPKDDDFHVDSPNNGRYEVELNVKGRKVTTQWRVAYIPGGRTTLRWSNKESRVLRLEELNLHPSHIEIFKTAISGASGVILVAGKTGGGKTTLVAALLSEIGKGKEVHTLEDPVEIDLSEFGIPQTLVEIDKTVVNTDKRKDFNLYGKQLLRHDLDAEFHSEIRDHQGAMTVCRKGETGQLMLATLHTSSAQGVAHTLIEQMRVPVSVVAAPDLMKVWVYSALVRKLCRHCCMDADTAIEYYQKNGNTEMVKKISINIDLIDFKGRDKGGIKFKNPDGCKYCLAGEHGRIPLLEVLILDDEDRSFILKGDYLGWRDALIRKGFVTVQHQALSKIFSGDIDMFTAMGRVNNIINVPTADIYKTIDI